ncbi:MAG TPA: helix-hairpin-helix domain-containing protein [Anaerolineales bacterium]|jgi:hypothetical protein
MVHANPPNKLQDQHLDDLKQIHGIGPVMEERLHGAGIFTFAQIADMSAGKLARIFNHIPGMTAERIIEKGWIKQAKELAEEQSHHDAIKPADDGQYSAVFSVDLLFDNQNHVRRTHVIHAQSREETNWAGWDQDKLVNFIIKKAGIKPALLQSETHIIFPEPTEVNLEPEKKSVAFEFLGDLQLPEFEIRPESGQSERWNMDAGIPMIAEMELDLSRTKIPTGIPIRYEAYIYAKSLSTGTLQVIGKGQGILRSSNTIPLQVNCLALGQGTYRLDAFITISPDNASMAPRASLMAVTEGRIFSVS